MLTLGGYDKKNWMNFVHGYMRIRNIWKALPQLPECFAASSATILNDIAYNFGGDISTQSVLWLDLFQREKWEGVSVLGKFCFKLW